MDPDEVAKLLAGPQPPPGMLSTPPPHPRSGFGPFYQSPDKWTTDVPAGPTQDYGMHLGHGPQFPYAMGVGPDIDFLKMEAAKRDAAMMKIQDPALRAQTQERNRRDELSPIRSDKFDLNELWI